MSNQYDLEKNQFINKLEDKAVEYGVEVVGRDHPSFLLDNGVAAHVRATRDQHNPIKLIIDEEVRFEASSARDDVKDVFTVLLDIQGQRGFSPHRDDFYPIPERVITSDHFVTERPSDGHYQLTINLLRYPAKKWRNEWSMLFGSRNEGDDGKESPKDNGCSGSDRDQRGSSGVSSDVESLIEGFVTTEYQNQ